MPIGPREKGSLTGKTLTSGRPEENRNADLGRIVRKRPVATRLIRTSRGTVTTVTRG